MSKKKITCAICPFKPADKRCTAENKKAPPFCPTKSKCSILQNSLKEYEDPFIKEFAQKATIQEGKGYTLCDNRIVKPIKPRIEEIIEFCEKMNFKNIGLAFCVGLMNEARVVNNILTDRGLNVISAICKVGGTAKEELGIKDNEKIYPGHFEPICNPIMQAKIFNENNTDFNVLLGLCVGHDSLFFKHSKSMCTVFAVKDRLLGHNPLAAIYTNKSYYKYLNIVDGGNE